MTCKTAGLFYLMVTIFLFSTFEVTSKYLSPFMLPTQITFIRFFIGGIFLLPFAVSRMIRKNISLSIADILKMVFLGIVNIVFSMGLIQLGLVYTNASICAVLFSINPLFVIIFAKLLIGEKITAAKITGLGFGISGLAVLFYDSRMNGSSDFYGLVLILLAAICFAFYTVAGKKIINHRIDSLIVTAFSFLAGSLIMIPFQAVLKIPVIPDMSKIIPQVIYMSVFVTGIAYYTYFEGLSQLEAGAGSMLYFAKPALASIFAVILLHERISLNLFAGILIIGSGIFISQNHLFLKKSDSDPGKLKGSEK
ncbi:MAG: EamA family transporter [Spirochaetes bacterium]|nr:EamA family transporter [Spirochaetota bacterium]